MVIVEIALTNVTDNRSLKEAEVPLRTRTQRSVQRCTGRCQIVGQEVVQMGAVVLQVIGEVKVR